MERSISHERGAYWVSVVITVLLLVLAAVSWFLWSVPSYATREFEWKPDEIGPAQSEIFVSAIMYITFRSDGPFAAGSPIYGSEASLYILTNASPSGHVNVEIRSGINSTGKISFEFASLETDNESDPARYYHASIALNAGSGNIITSTPGVAILKAYVILTLDGIDFHGWSQYQFTPFDNPETWIDMSPASDLYTFLGLKAAAVGLFLATASQVFPAVESARRLWRYERSE